METGTFFSSFLAIFIDDDISSLDEHCLLADEIKAALHDDAVACQVLLFCFNPNFQESLLQANNR